MKMFIVDTFTSTMDWLVRAYAADLPDKPDWSTSLYGSWFLSPAQHGFEFIAFNAAIVSLFLLSLGQSLRKLNLQKLLKQYRKTQHLNSIYSRLFDRIMLGCCIGVFGIMLAHKYQKDMFLFLLQPCHMNLMTFIILFMMDPAESIVPHLIFNAVLHLNWGAFLAIATPDLRDCDLFLEYEIFWIEHYLLLIIPVYCMIMKKFVVFELSFPVAVTAFMVKAFYHSFLLSAVALRTSINLNYVLVPPVGPLAWFGKWYRLVMYIFSFMLTLLMRYGFWNAIHRSIQYIDRRLLFQPPAVSKRNRVDVRLANDALKATYDNLVLKTE